MPTLTQELQETAILTQDKPSNTVRRLPEQLRPYWFKPGHPPSGGRPKGSKNRLKAADILKMRETRIAKHYVERAEKSDTVLIDAMKHLLPKESAGSSAPQLIIFMGNNDLLPRSIPPQDIVSSLPDNFSDPRRIAVSEAASVENA